MIPSIRSIKELSLISQSIKETGTSSEKSNLNSLTEDSGQRKRYLRSKYDSLVDLPRLPKININKWKRRQNVVSKFFDELHYTSEVQSTNELRLTARQNKKANIM